MNCHKQINGEGKPYASEIKKIYSAAGYDPTGSGKYTGNTKPIVWNKVHVLPDHVYFNHSQHVVVGGIDCKQCHGDMTKMKETAKVQPVSELNKIEGKSCCSRNNESERSSFVSDFFFLKYFEKKYADTPIITRVVKNKIQTNVGIIDSYTLFEGHLFGIQQKKLQQTTSIFN
jgi:hypothetical protein